MVSNLETIQVDGRMCIGYMQVPHCTCGTWAPGDFVSVASWSPSPADAGGWLHYSAFREFHTVPSPPPPAPGALYYERIQRGGSCGHFSLICFMCYFWIYWTVLTFFCVSLVLYNLLIYQFILYLDLCYLYFSVEGWELNWSIWA